MIAVFCAAICIFFGYLSLSSPCNPVFFCIAMPCLLVGLYFKMWEESETLDKVMEKKLIEENKI